MTETHEDGKIMQVLKKVLHVDPFECRGVVESRRAQHPTESPRELAQRIVSSYARKGAVEGFGAGLPSNPFTMVPAALADLAVVLHFYAKMTAAIGYLADRDYFDDPDWSNDALVMLAGPKVVSRVLKEAGIKVGERLTRSVIRKYLSKGVLRALKKWMAKWLGVKLGQRALISKAVPIVGGFIGGAWNFVEISAVGKRIIAYQFDHSSGTADSESVQA